MNAFIRVVERSEVSKLIGDLGVIGDVNLVAFMSANA